MAERISQQGKISERRLTRTERRLSVTAPEGSRPELADLSPSQEEAIDIESKRISEMTLEEYKQHYGTLPSWMQQRFISPEILKQQRQEGIDENVREAEDSYQNAIESYEEAKKHLAEERFEMTSEQRKDAKEEIYRLRQKRNFWQRGVAKAREGFGFTQISGWVKGNVQDKIRIRIEKQRIQQAPTQVARKEGVTVAFKNIVTGEMISSREAPNELWKAVFITTQGRELPESEQIRLRLLTQGRKPILEEKPVLEVQPVKDTSDVSFKDIAFKETFFPTQATREERGLRVLGQEEGTVETTKMHQLVANFLIGKGIIKEKIVERFIDLEPEIEEVKAIKEVKGKVTLQEFIDIKVGKLLNIGAKKFGKTVTDIGLIEEGATKQFLFEPRFEFSPTELGKFVAFESALMSTTQTTTSLIKRGVIEPVAEETKFLADVKKIEKGFDVKVFSKTEVGGTKVKGISRQLVKDIDEGLSVGVGKAVLGRKRTKAQVEFTKLDVLGASQKLGESRLVSEVEGIVVKEALGIGITSRTVTKETEKILQIRGLNIGTPKIIRQETPKFLVKPDIIKGARVEPIIKTEIKDIIGTIQPTKQEGLFQFLGTTEPLRTKLTEKGFTKILDDINIRGLIRTEGFVGEETGNLGTLILKQEKTMKTLQDTVQKSIVEQSGALAVKGEKVAQESIKKFMEVPTSKVSSATKGASSIIRQQQKVFEDVSSKGKFQDLTGQSIFGDQTTTKFRDLGVMESRFGSLLKDLDKQSDKAVQNVSGSVRQDVRQRTRQKQQPASKEKQQEKLITEQIIKQEQKQEEKIKQILTLELETKFDTTPKITTPPTVLRTPAIPIIAFPFKFKFRGTKTTGVTGKGFNVFGKQIRTNRYKKLNKVPLARGDAKSLGAYLIDTSLSTNFKIRPTRKKAQEPKLNFPRGYFTAVEHKLRDFRIKKGKRLPLKDKWIEKKGFPRLDTIQEVRKINLLKRLSQIEKRSGLKKGIESTQTFNINKLLKGIPN